MSWGRWQARRVPLALTHFSDSSPMCPHGPNESPRRDKNLLVLPSYRQHLHLQLSIVQPWPTIIIPQEGAVSARCALARPRETTNLNPLISKVPLNSGALGGSIKARTEGGSVSRVFPLLSSLHSSPLTRFISVWVCVWESKERVGSSAGVKRDQRE